MAYTIEDTIVIAKLLKEYHEELLDRMAGTYVRNGDSDDTYLLQLIHQNEANIKILNNDKVDKIPGKGLSTNDFTNALLTKLQNLKPNVNPDWLQQNSSEPDYIFNKPTKFYDDTNLWNSINELYDPITNPKSIAGVCASFGFLQAVFVQALPTGQAIEPGNLYLLETTDSLNNTFYEPYVADFSTGNPTTVSLWKSLQSIYDDCDLRYCQVEVVTTQPTLATTKERVLYIYETQDSLGNNAYHPYMRFNIGGVDMVMPLMRSEQEIFDSCDTRYLRVEHVSVLPAVSVAEYRTLYILEKADSLGNIDWVPYIKENINGTDELKPLIRSMQDIYDNADSRYIQKEVVTSLPTTSTARSNVLYILKTTDSAGNTIYQPYMLINGNIEPVGSAGSGGGSSSGGGGTASFSIVTTLPTASTANPNTIYFLKQSDGQGGFTYNGYILDSAVNSLVPFSGSGSGTGAFTFDIDANGDLILYYTNGTPPQANINTNGQLILTIN